MLETRDQTPSMSQIDLKALEALAKRLVKEASEEAAEKLREDIRNEILERDRTARLRRRGFNAMNGTVDPRPRQRDL